MKTNKIFYLLRGVSGSGKSSLAEELRVLYSSVQETAWGANVFYASADNFFMQNGKYEFNPDLLSEAHYKCYNGIEEFMENYEKYHIGQFVVILDNTNTQEKHFKKYIDLAEKYGYTIVSLVVENRHGNESVHNVDERTLERQEARLRGSIKLR